VLFRGGRREDEVLAAAEAVGEGVDEDIDSILAAPCIGRMQAMVGSCDRGIGRSLRLELYLRCLVSEYPLYL